MLMRVALVAGVDANSAVQENLSYMYDFWLELDGWRTYVCVVSYMYGKR